MGNWADANLRNHVSGDQVYSLTKFLDTYAFVDRPSNRYLPFKLKNMRTPNNLKYSVMKFEDFNREIEKLTERSPSYKFDVVSNNKPMQDSYFAVGYVYLYQILLAINNKWTLLDYNSDKLPRVKIPTKRGIQEMFVSMLKNKYYHAVVKLKSPEEIQKAIELLITDIDEDLSMADMASMKLQESEKYERYMKRLKSPLVTKYLSRQINKILYNYDQINEETLSIVLSNLLDNLNLFLK